MTVVMQRRTEIENIHIKSKFPQVLRSNMGIVTYACNELGVQRSTYYWWYNHDEEFAAACDDVIEQMADVVESELYKKIMNGDTACIIFYCKTKLKHRGYVERIEQTGANGDPINLKITESDNEIIERALQRRLKRMKYADTSGEEGADSGGEVYLPTLQ